MNLEDPEDASPTSGKRRKVRAHGSQLVVSFASCCRIRASNLSLSNVSLFARGKLESLPWIRRGLQTQPIMPKRDCVHAHVRGCIIEGWLDMPLAVQCSLSSQHVFLLSLQKRKPKQGAAQGHGADPESASQNQVDKQEAASR